ncbi:NADH:flavin oxidoreductase [Roseomonas chloroacetimidivorans]|uniref:NADH:flavin oxidoreductase n=1 Tax=Roseomonas chloroacetimidivorans TaxID=1766656 RepID=UPI003C785038
MDGLLASLFQPFPFGRVMLRNRIAMAPMTRKHSPGGIPGPDVAAYYRRRAEGGVGLIITEGTTVGHPAANAYPQVPAFHGVAALEGWRRVVEAVHGAGGAIIPQLWHTGLRRRPGVEPDPSVPGFGPMRIEEAGQEVVRAMTRADIAAVVEAFAQAAADAERLGFDGVELHGAHEYLLDQFLWPGTNQRQDEYGGTLENRLRFPLEVVRAVRGAVRPDLPVVFRFSQWKLSDYAARLADTPEGLGEILRPLAEAGVDVFHASTRRFWEPAFPSVPGTLAAWAKRLTGRPCIAVGSVGLEDAPGRGRPVSEGAATRLDRLEVLAAGLRDADYDLVAVGRALLADPAWAEKLRQGRGSEILAFEQQLLEALT